MKFLFRADAGTSQGTGHVMRCLTLAAELVSRGHEVGLLTGSVEIDWLRVAIDESGVAVTECANDELPLDTIRELDPDWLIVDSYQIPAERISNASRYVSVLAIVDGDTRGIDATLFLDQNLGAEQDHPHDSTFLAGADYALVRRQVIDAERPEPWKQHGPIPRVLCFMGGTDATGTVSLVAAAVASLGLPIELTVVAPEAQHADITRAVRGPGQLRLEPPTPELPRLFADADIVISAAGTSSWDICTLGIPAVFLAVVENQRAGLAQILSRELALGIDATVSGVVDPNEVGDRVAELLGSEGLRERLSRNALHEFDGRGAWRVAERLEREVINPLLEW